MYIRQSYVFFFILSQKMGSSGSKNSNKDIVEASDSADGKPVLSMYVFLNNFEYIAKFNYNIFVLNF